MTDKAKPLFQTDFVRLVRGPKAKRVTVQEWNGDEWVKWSTFDPSGPVVHVLLDLGLSGPEIEQALGAVSEQERRRAPSAV